MSKILTSNFLFNRRIAFTCVTLSVAMCLLLAAGRSDAAINYLVINTTGGGVGNSAIANISACPATTACAYTMSISLTCPAGNAVHAYGIRDITNVISYNATNGYGAYQISWSPASTGAGICIAGVPSTITVTPLPRDVAPTGITQTASVAANVTLGGATMNFNFIKGVDGLSNPYSGAGIILPDGFTIQNSGFLGGANAYTGIMIGMLGTLFGVHQGTASYSQCSISAPGFMPASAGVGTYCSDSIARWNWQQGGTPSYVIGY